ncbi:MAG: alpha-galactosidase, partial [Prevotella sp.]|nr:alpha-galactosidase [Prevotella sp.]
MNRHRIYKSIFQLLCVVGLFLLPTTEALAQVSVKVGRRLPDVETWIKTTFARGKVPPFSFIYDGQPSASFIKTWRYESTSNRTDNPDVVSYTFTYTQPTDGLRVRCEVKGYVSFGSIDWVLHVENNGRTDSKPLRALQAIDLGLRYGKSGQFVMNYVEGSQITKDDFQPRQLILPAGKPMVMSPEGGRSSQGKYTPFFCITSPQGGGVMLSIGWTGNWQASVCAQSGNEVSLKAGQKRFDLYLHPSEQIRTPRVNIMFWEGADYLAGTNQFRRLVLAHNSRRIDGKVAQYPFSTGFNYHEPQPMQEYSCLTQQYAIAMVNRNYRFDIRPDVFWLDAGWHQDAGDYQHGRNWANTTGNWTIDSARFGGTLRPIANAIHRHGAKFMVWFEPERVVVGTQWAVEHNKWMLHKPQGGDWLLFNLADPKACEWLCQYYGKMIEDNGIDYYRQDCNIEPEPYWEAADEPNRAGITEIRYIEGLYRFWDYLLQRFPHLLIDNCASGGRRIDWETTGRSAPLWQSDYYHYYATEGLQTQNYGLNLFLPFHGTGVATNDAYAARSSYSSAMICHWKLTTKQTNLEVVHRSINEYLSVKPYYTADYYPLTGVDSTTAANRWLAYQLNRTSDGTGVILA